MDVTCIPGRKWSEGLRTARLGDLSYLVLVFHSLRDFQFLSTNCRLTVLIEAGTIHLLVRSDDAALSLYTEVKKAHKFS